MSTWLRRVWHLLNRGRRERELVSEMHDHRSSMHDPSTFGDTYRLLEQSRDAWGWNWLDDAMQDVRFALRGLLRAPVFAITATLMLSFGIGLNLTVYQMATTVLLRPPALNHPDTLARLHRHGKSLRSNSEAVPYVLSQAVARDAAALSAVFVTTNAAVVWGDHSGVDATFVSPNWFAQLEQTALHGRAFSDSLDAGVDAPAAVVVSYGFWKRVLGSEPGVIGTSTRINQRPATIVGVMPEKTAELDMRQSDIWLLITQRDYYFPNALFLTDWESNNVSMYTRLKPGVTAAAARENVRGVMAALHDAHPDQIETGEWLEPAMAATNFTEPAERMGFIGVASTISLLTTMVLMVAAANLGNLVLARVSSRSRELGVRVALGARRSRIVRQLAVETLPLGLTGAVGGVLFAFWAARLIALFAGAPVYLDFTPDVMTIVVGLFWMMLALVVVGALPAWKISKQDLTDAIKDGGQQVSMRLDRARLRSLMLALQIGGSCVVLIVSAMMVRSLQRALTINPGFSYEQTAVVQSAVQGSELKGEAAQAYWMRLKERIEATPEVKQTALALTAPFSGRGFASRYPDAQGLTIFTNHVEANFFDVMDIRLMSGRTFDARDAVESTVVISRALAHTMYGTTDVLGRAFPKSDPHDTIIGIAADASLVRPGASGTAEVYRPLSTRDFEQAVLLVRARADASGLVPILREEARKDSKIFAGVRLLKNDFAQRVAGTEIASSIGASIGGLTLLLACIGIFGVVSYGITLRIKELGIHLALGATRRTILSIATRHAARPLIIGIAAGTLAAAPIAFALSKSPLQLAFTDPLSYLGALSILSAAGLAAAITPVLRALQSDPIRALRHQ